MENNNNVTFCLGDIVKVTDKLDCRTVNYATINGIEQDDEMPEITWLYLIANDDRLNDKFDAKLGRYYWCVLESTNPYIEFVSRAVD